jgi:uncharacterized membrane protein
MKEEPMPMQQNLSSPDPARLTTNVSNSERWVSSLCGVALLSYGLKRRGWGSFALGMMGAGLLLHGLSGRNWLYDALGIRMVRTTRGRQLVEVIKTMTINRRPDEVYEFWRNFENLPRFMRHLQFVKVLDEKRSLWVANAPGGITVKWEAKIVNEKPNELIAWESVEGADIRHWGVVRFFPVLGGKGTEIKVELEYEPIGGTMGTALAKIFGEEPAQQIEEDLHRFKQVMEAGE